MQLAFDHERILSHALERAKSKLEYSPLAAAFPVRNLPWHRDVLFMRPSGAPVSTPGNFHRKATGTPGFLESTGRMTAGDAGRPAALFRLAATARPTACQPSQAVLNPPLIGPRD